VISHKFQSSLPPALRSALEQRLSAAGLVKPSFTQLVREAVEAFRLQGLVRPTSSPTAPSPDAKRTLPPDEDLIHDLNITRLVAADSVVRTRVYNYRAWSCRSFFC
jgi:hypothetical protein